MVPNWIRICYASTLSSRDDGKNQGKSVLPAKVKTNSTGRLGPKRKGKQVNDNDNARRSFLFFSEWFWKPIGRAATCIWWIFHGVSGFHHCFFFSFHSTIMTCFYRTSMIPFRWCFINGRKGKEHGVIFRVNPFDAFAVVCRIANDICSLRHPEGEKVKTFYRWSEIA